MRLHEYMAQAFWPSDANQWIEAAAGTVVILAAVVPVALKVMWTVRRRANAARVAAGWGPIDASTTGATVWNRSRGELRNAMVTVVCGLPAGSETRLDLPFLGSREESSWAAGEVHAHIDARLAGRSGGAPGRPPAHNADGHRVQVTFGDGRQYWFREGTGGRVTRLDTLVIWAEATRAKTLAQFFGRRSRFRREYRVSVTVQPFPRTEDLEEAFRALTAREGVPHGYDTPDIVVGPHDWIGRVARAESVIDLPLSAAEEAQFDPTALGALRRDGRQYAIPYVFDSVALLRNRTLAGTGAMPTTIDAVIACGRDALAAHGIPDSPALAMQVGPPNERGEAGDPFHLWPLFSSAGGGFFGLKGQPGSRSRWEDLDLWREGFIEAFARVAGLGAGGAGVLRPEVGRADALRLFAAGRAPYLVCSSRALKTISDQRLDVDVAAVPPLGNAPAQPMVSVYGFFICRDAPNRQVARDLVTHYLHQRDAGMDLNEIQPLVPVQRQAMTDVAARNPLLLPYVRQCRTGLIMPSYPEMRQAWNLLGRTEYAVLAGDGNPRAVAGHAADEGWQLLEGVRGAS
ncbi:MAG: arabinogalactan oligomer / maltooligosaccharide transport system substrate-binding protein [Micromonosporaceae bacterium]|nr:arabinogalactan oligomer / maltooligosaccharide transport system substrate-binding protein [Micromonosporaceae bacterium]